MATKKRVSAKIVRPLAKQRKIQAEVDRKDAAKPKKPASRKAIQTGVTKYPGNPLPEQHHEKPGLESEIVPAPMFRNPAYYGSAKLEGMTALITGGDSGIGRAVAVRFAREGADVAVTGSYITGLVLPVIGGTVGAMTGQKE